MPKLLIFLLITIIALHLNLNSKEQDKQEMVTQEMLKQWFH